MTGGRTDPLLRAALVLLSVLVVLPAGLAVWLVVSGILESRQYGDEPPAGGYAQIFGVLLLVVLAVPAVLTLQGWLFRRRRPGASVVMTVLGGGFMVVLGAVVSALLLPIPGLVVVGLAVASHVRRSRASSAGIVEPDRWPHPGPPDLGR